MSHLSPDFTLLSSIEDAGGRGLFRLSWEPKMSIERHRRLRGMTMVGAVRL